MVLTGGLLRRFKCLLTSNFCLEPPSLVEEDTEIKTPHKQKTRTTLTPHPQPITTTTLFNKQQDLVSQNTNPKKKMKKKNLPLRLLGYTLSLMTPPLPHLSLCFFLSRYFFLTLKIRTPLTPSN